MSYLKEEKQRNKFSFFVQFLRFETSSLALITIISHKDQTYNQSVHHRTMLQKSR